MAEKDQAKIEADLQKLETVIQKAKAAQKKFSTYTQAQVDEIFRMAAIAANARRIELAKDAAFGIHFSSI